MGDIIITNRVSAPISVRELIEVLEREFDADDFVTTGLWIRKLQPKPVIKHSRKG